jgi:D-cysteine desulfhydrase family pyridoxal phosphate-dependent enzyme
MTLPRFPLGFFPTPLHEMKRLSKALGGPRLFIKRDDQTGLAMGGNKTRKLEFLIADALRQGADTIITAGAAQSNHCRQTAAAAAVAGLRCELVLGGEPADVSNGNLLLDQLLGASVHWTGMERRGEKMEEIASAIRAQNCKPYVIPYGGSNGVGAAAYAEAMLELIMQMKSSGVTLGRCVVASSSGGTQAGLVLGAKAHGFPGLIVGISIDKGERGDRTYEEEMAEISNAAARQLGLDITCTGADFIVRYDYLGSGYGIMAEFEREAIRLTARLEGILLDPVYTGRAMGGMMDMIRRGEFGAGEAVLFWHTGGAPALFAYAKDLSAVSTR